jgi:hypothetical protein
VLDRLVGSTISTGIRVKTTNGMTLGGAKEVIVLKKGPRCWVYSKKHNQ